MPARPIITTVSPAGFGSRRAATEVVWLVMLPPLVELKAFLKTLSSSGGLQPSL
jgi:hypothetical protein